MEPKRTAQDICAIIEEHLIKEEVPADSETIMEALMRLKQSQPAQGNYQAIIAIAAADLPEPHREGSAHLVYINAT